LYLHIGADCLIPISEIIAVVSNDAGDNNKMLDKTDKTAGIVDITTERKQSWVITERFIYRTPISTQTLKSRLINSCLANLK